MDTTNIENIANRLLQEQDSAFMDFVREETSLKDTFLLSVIKAKTSLGEVLQELQYSQESSSRKLLSRKTFKEAEKEARELFAKEAFTDAIREYCKSFDSSSITKMGSGQFLVSEFNDGEHRAQLFNADGTKNGSEYQVISELERQTRSIALTALSWLTETIRGFFVK